MYSHAFFNFCKVSTWGLFNFNFCCVCSILSLLCWKFHTCLATSFSLVMFSFQLMDLQLTTFDSHGICGKYPIINSIGTYLVFKHQIMQSKGNVKRKTWAHWLIFPLQDLQVLRQWASGLFGLLVPFRIIR
jgi:hypothetical protein